MDWLSLVEAIFGFVVSDIIPLLRGQTPNATATPTAGK